MYKIATISWRMAGAVAAGGYRLDDHDRWTKPILFHNNRKTDGLQWKRHLDIVFPPESQSPGRYNMAVQYLARVGKLRCRRGASGRYHKTTCSEEGCNVKTRAFHTMLMRYICTKCVNRKMLTYSLMSRDTAKRSYAVTRTQLGSLPCARFRDANSFYGSSAPRWFMRQHVRKLSERVWRAKVSNIRKGYRAATKMASNLQPNAWKTMRSERLAHLNCKPTLEVPVPPVNSSVSLDLATDVCPHACRRYKPMNRILSALKDKDDVRRAAHRPVTAGTEEIWLLEFTVGLNGGRSQVVDDPNPKSRKLKTRRMQAAVRRKRKRKTISNVVSKKSRKIRTRKCKKKSSNSAIDTDIV